MALAPAAYVLWTRFLRFDPVDPEWFDRVDRDCSRSRAANASMVRAVS
jgi:hypothetical protein